MNSEGTSSGQSAPQMIAVPSDDEFLADISHFALSYDGYALNGDRDGTSNCARLANTALNTWHHSGTLPESLHDLRSCLFFEQRRLHFGSDGHETIEYMLKLVQRIREVAGGHVELSHTSPTARILGNRND